MFYSVLIRFVNVVDRSEHDTGCFYVFILCKCRDWVVCVPTIAIAMATFLTSAFSYTWNICGEERYHIYILQQAPFQIFARTLQRELIPECYHSVSHVLQQGMLAAQLFPVLLGTQTGTMLCPLIFGRWRDTLIFFLCDSCQSAWQYFVNLSSIFCGFMSKQSSSIILVSNFWIYAVAFFQSVKGDHPGFDNHHNVAKQTDFCCWSLSNRWLQACNQMLGGDRVLKAITLCMVSPWSKGNRGMLWKITMWQNLEKSEIMKWDSLQYMMVIWDTMWPTIYNNICSTIFLMRYISLWYGWLSEVAFSNTLAIFDSSLLQGAYPYDVAISEISIQRHCSWLQLSRLQWHAGKVCNVYSSSMLLLN